MYISVLAARHATFWQLPAWWLQQYMQPARVLAPPHGTPPTLQHMLLYCSMTCGIRNAR